MVVLLAAAFLACLVAPTAQALEAGPARLARLRSGHALWVKRDQMISADRIVRFVDEAADNGYNVLFVQVRGRGDAWYQSRIVPRADLLKNATYEDGTPFDPLDFLLRQAHARNIEVHVWLNALLAWSGEAPPESHAHVMNRHPDWVAVDAGGRSLADYSQADIQRANIEGAFLASGNPAVRRHLREVVAEIAVNYNVDGIHLDYIRNPLVDAGYDPATRTAFMTQYGADPWKLRHGTAALRDRFGPEGVEAMDALWKSWRADQVTRLVADIRSDLDEVGRPLVLSAAVFPNCRTAPVDVGQDWMTWCKKGYVDMVVPMMYSPSTDVVMRQLELAQRELPLDVIFYAGLAVYNQPLLSVAEKAVRCRNAGVNGICFFPYDTLAEHPGALHELSRMAFGRVLARRGEGKGRGGAGAGAEDGGEKR